MKFGKLKSIEDFAEESSVKLETFENLRSRSPHDPECGAFVYELQSWLLSCVTHGRYLATGSPERLALQGLINEWKARLRREGLRLDGIDQLVDFDPNAGVVLEVECPYPGLDAYRADRAGSFFGRTELVKRYVRHIGTNRIFLILGASGSGKSSLALAGVWPKMQELHPEWIYPDDFTPGSAPLAALATVVATAVGKPNAAEPLARALRKEPGSAPTQLAELSDGRSLTLLVDQLEELITLCRDPDEQAAFAAVLVALSEPPTSDDGWVCYTLLTLRTDHLARFESSNALKPLYVRLVDNHNSELLTTLSFEDIKRAIAEPAKAVGLRFAPPTIIEGLASQTAGLANGLPLLQFSLRRLWDTRPTDKETEKPLDLVTQAMMDTLPDVQRSLGTVAEGIFVNLTKRQQAICGRALQELVLLDENFEEPLRRRRNRIELSGVLEGRFPGAREDIVEVERQFIAAGLLRTFGQGEDEQVEVAHEALLRHWERLNQAVSGEEAKRRLHAVKQIGREAMEWQARGGREDFLKQQGEPLQLALKYLGDGWLAEAESKAYVEACVRRDAFITRVVKARKLIQWWGLAAAVATLIVGISIYFAKIQREEGLSTIASLAERLPPWEGLDVAYNVAKSGGTDYRFALGHALERMDDSWMPGKRDASLFPVGDGTALLQFDNSQAMRSLLLVYLIGPDGSPNEKAIAVDIGIKSDRLAQAQVGPAIKNGIHQGQHLLVLALLPQASSRSYSIKGYLLDPKAGTYAPLDVNGEATSLQAVDELFPIRIHPDGDRAIWSAIDYRKLESHIQELSFDAEGRPAIRPVADRVPASLPATAVAFEPKGNDTTELITGRLDGAIYCGNRKLVLNDPKDVIQIDSSPVRNIVTHPTADVFAATKFTGQVLAASCATTDKAQAHAFQLVSSDPNSLRLTPVRQELDSTRPPAWVVSYFDGDRQLRCYQYDPNTRKDRWWLCNGAHLIGAAVLMTDQGQQLVVERSDVAEVRRYPNEELSRNGKQVNARGSRGSTLRWTSQTGSAVGDLNEGDEPPWVVKGSDIKPKPQRQIEAAALSPDGQRIVWIERLRTADHRDVVPGIKDPKLQKTVSLIGSMNKAQDKADPWMSPQDGFAQAVTIDDRGRIAYVHAAPDGSGKAMLTFSNHEMVELDAQDGGAQCLEFSPSGHYLVLGTSGGRLRRLAVDKPASESIVLSRNPDEAKEGRAKASITACAVADDGAVAAGYADWQVLYFSAEGKPTQLTARAVYSFLAPIKDVRIDPSGTPRRVTALGEWQINNCVQPGLPGQTVRAWDLTLPEAQRGTPVAVACFPNAAIAALGAWGQKRSDDVSGECPKAGETNTTTQDGPLKVGLCLITAQGSRWHACPACGQPGDTPDVILTGAISSAKQEGAKPLDDVELERRYGFKLGPWP